ncbi:MAG: hypothetical protein ACOC8N_09150, partial [Spirochaetota bacterium]
SGKTRDLQAPGAARVKHTDAAGESCDRASLSESKTSGFNQSLLPATNRRSIDRLISRMLFSVPTMPKYPGKPRASTSFARFYSLYRTKKTGYAAGKNPAGGTAWPKEAYI